MDPLSVAASVVGLLIAGAQISAALQRFASGTVGAPSLAEQVQQEVHDFTVVVSKLQPFLLQPSLASSPQAHLIDVDQVLVALTGCVCTFSELQFELDKIQLDSPMGFRSRLRWTLAGSTFSGLMQRLQNHKISLTLILTILTCGSSVEARDNLDRLCTTLEQIVQNNGQLSSRLTTLESELAAFRPAAQNSASSITTIRTQHSYQLPFEKILFSTRVYRRALLNSSAASFTTVKSRRTHLSFVSGLSISEVSNISVLLLPISSSELHNPQCYENPPVISIAVDLVNPCSEPTTTDTDLSTLYNGLSATAIHTTEDSNQTAIPPALPLSLDLLIGYEAPPVIQTEIPSGGDTSTTLHRAASLGMHNVVKSLLQGGASIDARTVEGYTALYLAAEGGCCCTVGTLLHSGANLEARPGAKGDTPLLIAVRNGNAAVITLLLAAGADINAKDTVGHIAVQVAAEYGWCGIVAVLLKNGRKKIAYGRPVVDSALVLAVKSGNVETVSFLLNFGANVHSRNDQGRTLIELAGMDDNIELVRLLKEAMLKKSMPKKR